MDDCSPERATADIGQLDADVDALVASGDLNGGQGNALTKKLDNALKHLGNGKTSQARQSLVSFQDSVMDLVADGDLGSVEGQALIDAAQAIIDDLTP